MLKEEEDYKYQTEMNIALNSLLEKKAEKLKIFKKNYATLFCKENEKGLVFPFKNLLYAKIWKNFVENYIVMTLPTFSKLPNLSQTKSWLS